MPLSPAHFKDLRRSGLSNETIETMAAYSVPPAETARLSPLLTACESVLAFPYPGLNGFCRYRLYPPRDGLKYWQPPGSPTHLYTLASVSSILSNPTIELAITEGEKKAACLTQHGMPAVGIAGIWSWIKPETAELHDEFTKIAFVDRSILIVFDSDTWTRSDIQKPLYALGKLIEAKGGKVEAVVIPPAGDGSKQGADDFIVANSIEAFKKLKRIKLRHDSLAQHKSWFEQWRDKKNSVTDKSRLVLSAPEPWPEPVDGDDLTRESCRTHRRFVDATAAQTLVVALWCIHAHAINSFDISPFLILTSATMRSGKTTTILVTERLVPKPLLASNITAPAFYRAIEAYQPTVVLDEFEHIIEALPELKGIINSSHCRRTAYVLRTEGDDFAPRLLSTWSPKCFGLIGKLPPTAADRSIEIRMRRKLKTVKKESFKLANDYTDLEIIRRKIARWVFDNADAVKTATPPRLQELDDRSNDNWAPLFMIAAALGGPWLGYAQTAALEVNEIKADDSVSIQLLADIRSITKGTDKIFSRVLLEELINLEERPWATYNRGKPISHRQISKMLTAYDIQTNRTVRIGNETNKGFQRAWLEEVFHRYLAPDTAEDVSEESHRSPCRNSNNLTAIFDQSQSKTVTDENTSPNGDKYAAVTDVTDKNPNGAWEEL